MGGDAENLRVRARLVAPLERYVRERGITREEAAEELGTTQARVSERVNGKMLLKRVENGSDGNTPQGLPS